MPDVALIAMLFDERSQKFADKQATAANSANADVESIAENHCSGLIHSRAMETIAQSKTMKALTENALLDEENVKSIEQGRKYGKIGGMAQIPAK